MSHSFVDIHCHLLPGIDDGAKNWDDTLAMARMAVEDGTSAIICTPHQLGNFIHNEGDTIRSLVNEVRERLIAEEIPLSVLPGADIRIEPGMVDRIHRGEVLSLGDYRRHVLLELPHELYIPLEPILGELTKRKMTGILSHPERNDGILRKPEIIEPLVEAGCLMQITAGSLCGTMGPACQTFSEQMLAEGFVHFIASDGHSPRTRRPLMRRAFVRVAELVDKATAIDLCCRNPAAVAADAPVQSGRRNVVRRKRGWFARRSVA